jgi:hypothetical protein
MQKPQFSDSEFMNAAVFNTAATTVESSLDDIGAYLHTPGVINASALTMTPTSLVVSVVCGSTFGVLFSSGEICHGHGNTDGALNSTYSLNFASLVPGSGSVTAYVVASYASIQQNPYQVIGPPPGHPDYDPTFNPYTAYATILNSLSIVATTTAPNGTTTIELGRVTLSSGQTSIPSVSTANQTRAGAVLSRNGDVLASDLAAGAAIANIGYTPVQQGGGTGQGTNKVYLGWDGASGLLRYQIDSTDEGDIASTNWVNTNFVSDSTFNSYINQPVLTTSDPTFSDVNITGLGNLHASILNQAVQTGSSPTFAEVITNNISSQYGSSTNPGYIHFTSGLIMQFGQNNTASNTFIAFGVTFPTACISVVVSESAASGTWGSGAVTVHGTSSQGNTGFVHWSYTWNGTSWINANNDFNWVAIGV